MEEATQFAQHPKRREHGAWALAVVSVYFTIESSLVSILESIFYLFILFGIPKGECEIGWQCKRKDDCLAFKEKQKQLNATTKNTPEYDELVIELRNLVCYAREQLICCEKGFPSFFFSKDKNMKNDPTQFSWISG